MSDIAIRVENLGKLYQLGERQRYHSLRETLSRSVRGVGRALHSLWSRGGRPAEPAAARQDFWALHDVSFDVTEGQVIGVIGRNGAGKSTLLKILSRITEPTTGSIELHGRVGSLLEVGTGFHPELTGRENVYLNGAILGMRRREIQTKFDDIVEFAEMAKFIDTPVKHYSSGMYMRLAFSVAAHLEPEILLVDEVLAVGDVEFQKRCLNKMEDKAHEGRTVLFVSHNVPAITRICPQSILIHRGQIARIGPSHEVVRDYLKGDTGSSAHRRWTDERGLESNMAVRFHSAAIRGIDGSIADVVDVRSPVDIELEYEVRRPGLVLVANYQVMNDEGICVFSAFDHDHEWKDRARPVGRYISTARIPGDLLAEGGFSVSLAVSTLSPHEHHGVEWEALAFRVVDGLTGESARGNFSGDMPGVVRPLLEWRTRTAQSSN